MMIEGAGIRDTRRLDLKEREMRVHDRVLVSCVCVMAMMCGDLYPEGHLRTYCLPDVNR